MIAIRTAVAKVRKFFLTSRRRWPAIFVIGVLLVIWRRPDVITYPQFWAEDGLWYADAYGLGPSASLLLPHSSYFQTISRLTAAAAVFLPLASGPVFFNCAAIFFRVLPAIFILSSRLNGVLPTARSKFLAAFVLIGLPQIAEVHSNITNSQWHMAMLSGLILIADAAPSAAWKIFDATMLILSGLSGPFVLILSPFAIIRAGMTRSRRLILPILATAAIEAASVASTLANARFHHELGASLGQFIEIASGQVFVGALLGARGFAWLVRHDLWRTPLVGLIFGSCLTLVAYAFWKADARLKLFWTYCFGVFGATLLQPAASTALPQWEVMAVPWLAGRYFFLPVVAFAGMVLWLSQKQNRLLIRASACCLLAVMAIGIAANWRLPPWPDLDFQHQAKKFEAAGAGKFDFAILPVGWTMTLDKP